MKNSLVKFLDNSKAEISLDGYNTLLGIMSKMDKNKEKPIYKLKGESKKVFEKFVKVGKQQVIEEDTFKAPDIDNGLLYTV